MFVLLLAVGCRHVDSTEDKFNRYAVLVEEFAFADPGSYDYKPPADENLSGLIDAAEKELKPLMTKEFLAKEIRDTQHPYRQLAAFFWISDKESVGEMAAQSLPIVQSAPDMVASEVLGVVGRKGAKGDPVVYPLIEAAVHRSPLGRTHVGALGLLEHYPKKRAVALKEPVLALLLPAVAEPNHEGLRRSTIHLCVRRAQRAGIIDAKDFERIRKTQTYPYLDMSHPPQ